MSEKIPDFPAGPLDSYRKKASFDWKKLKVFVHTEDSRDLLKVLQRHQVLSTTSNSFDEQRRISAQQAKTISQIEELSLANVIQDLKRPCVETRSLVQLCPSGYIKDSVSRKLFRTVLQSTGTSYHQQFAELVDNYEISGCFCLTEIGHGSNAKGMRTTATYNEQTQQFVLHTPDFEAAKCWAGGLGQLATHGVVYAQLYVKGVNYGLHTFLVPIRDQRTLIPFPGVIVGDMGEKIGLNGVDNGFIIFENYSICRKSLLNKNADVTPDGHYISRLKTAKDRHGAALGALSIGRVHITEMCESYGTKALTIAIRYAAIRKQFGPNDDTEVPILEYQSHQHRLLPYLAAAYVLRVFSIYLCEQLYTQSIDALTGNNTETLPERGMEMHVVSSACKPVAAWLFRDAIQECREACGGHGYLKSAGIGDIRNDHDANCTYEGENHVLIQQTSNFLVKLHPTLIAGVDLVASPMGSLNFLFKYNQIITRQCTARDFQTLCRAETIIDAYQWLTCYLLQETVKKQAVIASQGEFWAKNNTQVFYAKSLGIAFINHFFLYKYLEKINEATDPSIKKVLMRLFALFGLWTLEKNLGTLYEGGYIQGPEQSQLIRESVLRLCTEIKDDAVSLVDAIAPPDFFLNSVLGMSDGRVYQHLKSAIFQNANAMSRPYWWREVIPWDKDHSTSKL